MKHLKKSIKNKIVFQFTLLVTLFLLFIIGAFSLLVINSTKDESQKTLENRALSLQTKVEERMEYLISNTEQLSKNGLMINALLDDKGKKKYLTPLATNFMEDKNVVYLNIVDFDGKVIFQTSEDIIKYNESKHLRRALSMGITTYRLDTKNNYFIVISPMTYYNTTQGALIAIFNLENILDRYTLSVKEEYINIVDDKNIIYTNNFMKNEKYYSYLLQPKENSLFYKLNIKMKIGIKEDVYLSPVKEALYKLIVIGVILLLFGMAISYTLAISITKPILKLYNIVKDDKYKSEYEPLGTDDELEALSRTFYQKREELIKLKDEELEKQKLLSQQTKMASMGEMIGNIAHQWRQPLSIISTGATGMLVQKEFGELSDEQFKKTCQLIDQNAQYLSKTIDDFKNFIKGERRFVKFNVKETIDSFLTLVNPSIKKYDIEVITKVDDNIFFQGYPNELIQCFMNIFNNSKDILKEQENQARLVFIDATITSKSLVIKFKDSAGGIPDNIIAHVFEPYFTTKHAKQGTGLGLSMTYKLITEGMSGSIEADNIHFEYNGKNYDGAEFTIKLPVHKEL